MSGLAPFAGTCAEAVIRLSQQVNAKKLSFTVEPLLTHQRPRGLCGRARVYERDAGALWEAPGRVVARGDDAVQREGHAGAVQVLNEEPSRHLRQDEGCTRARWCAALCQGLLSSCLRGVSRGDGELGKCAKRTTVNGSATTRQKSTRPSQNLFAFEATSVRLIGRRPAEAAEPLGMGGTGPCSTGESMVASCGFSCFGGAEA